MKSIEVPDSTIGFSLVLSHLMDQGINLEKKNDVKKLVETCNTVARVEDKWQEIVRQRTPRPYTPKQIDHFNLLRTKNMAKQLDPDVEIKPRRLSTREEIRDRIEQGDVVLVGRQRQLGERSRKIKPPYADYLPRNPDKHEIDQTLNAVGGVNGILGEGLAGNINLVEIRWSNK